MYLIPTRDTVMDIQVICVDGYVFEDIEDGGQSKDSQSVKQTYDQLQIRMIL